MFLSTLRNLTVIHLKFLVMFNGPKKYLEDNNLKLSENITFSGTISALKQCFPMSGEDEIRLIVNDLHNSGLINLSPDFLGVTTSWGLGMIQGRLTNFGKELVDFITQPIQV